jgi:hypothetical protein
MKGTDAAPVKRWPLFLIAAPAAAAVWSGWVGLGDLCGFGLIHPLPGIAGSFQINTAITLPVGVEAYGAYALRAWLTPGISPLARKFAARSAIGSLGLGMAGQVIYHLLAAAHATRAPWPVVTLVSCLPVLALALGSGLAHLLREQAPGQDATPRPVQESPAGEERTGPDTDAEDHTGRRTDEGPHPYGEERTGPDTDAGDRTDDGPQPPGEVDRAAIVAELAEQIRDAIEAGERWQPDYPALMASTGRRRSWCEKAVREARTTAFRTAVRPPARTASPHGTGPTGTAPGPGEPARTDAPAPGSPARTGRPALHAVDGTAR